MCAPPFCDNSNARSRQYVPRYRAHARLQFRNVGYDVRRGPEIEICRGDRDVARARVPERADGVDPITRMFVD